MRIWLCAAALLLAAPAPGFSADRSTTCTMAIARAGEEAIDGVQGWPALHDWYRKYGACDQGSPAEGAQDKVQTLLADDWGRLPDYLRIVRADPAFETWVLGLFDEAMSRPEAAAILDNSLHACPPEGRSACRKFVKALPAL